MESNSNLARHGLLKTSTGINFLLKKIEEARKYVDTNGFVPQESLRFLPQNPGPSWLHASDKQALQKALDDEKTELQARKLLVEAEERSQRRARINAAAVPSKTPLERLDRYETSNRRHRYKLEKRLKNCNPDEGSMNLLRECTSLRRNFLRNKAKMCFSFNLRSKQS